MHAGHSQPLDLRKPLNEISVNVVGPLGKSNDIRNVLDQALIDFNPSPAPKKKNQKKRCSIPVLTSTASINIKKAAV